MNKTLLLMLVGFSSVSAYAAKYECDYFIETVQTVRGNTGNWLHNNVSNKLTFGQIFLTTNPKDGVFRLRGDEEKSLENVNLEIYNLDFYRKNGDKIYIECTYNGTSASIYKEIVAPLNHCELEYKGVNRDESNTFIVCR